MMIIVVELFVDRLLRALLTHGPLNAYWNDLVDFTQYVYDDISCVQSDDATVLW